MKILTEEIEFDRENHCAIGSYDCYNEWRIWEVGYGHQMCPYYGYFKEDAGYGNSVKMDYDILELWRQR